MLEQEILADVVNYDSLAQVSSKYREILYVELTAWQSVISEKSITNSFKCYSIVTPDLIYSPVSVVLHASSKNHDFIVLRHF